MKTDSGTTGGLRGALERVVRRLEQTGIDIRQSGQRAAMQRYIRHLKEELRMTEEFLSDDVKPPNVPDQRPGKSPKTP